MWALKPIFLWTLFTALSSASAQSNSAVSACKAKLGALAVNPVEKFVLANSIITDDLLKMLMEAAGDESGAKTCDERILETFIVVFHEGVHMIDLNYRSTDEIQDSMGSNVIQLLKKQKPRFYLPSGEFLTLPFPELPKPHTIYTRYWQHQKINLDKQASAEFRDWYESYVLDTDMLVSIHFFSGLTELNAYTHGTLSSRRLLMQNKQSPAYLATQAAGVLFFLNLTKIYLTELKRSYPQMFARLNKDAVLKSFVATLFANGVQSLSEFNFCEVGGDETHKDLYRDYRAFADEAVLASVVGVETVSRLHAALSCLK